MVTGSPGRTSVTPSANSIATTSPLRTTDGKMNPAKNAAAFTGGYGLFFAIVKRRIVAAAPASAVSALSNAHPSGTPARTSRLYSTVTLTGDVTASASTVSMFFANSLLTLSIIGASSVVAHTFSSAHEFFHKIPLTSWYDAFPTRDFSSSVNSIQLSPYNHECFKPIREHALAYNSLYLNTAFREKLHRHSLVKCIYGRIFYVHYTFA